MSYTITPPNSSPIRSKRGRDDDDNTHMKRWQKTRIFSETHQATVQMMMEAQRHLQPKVEIQDPEPEVSTYKQAPYWPQLNRVKQKSDTES